MHGTPDASRTGCVRACAPTGQHAGGGIGKRHRLHGGKASPPGASGWDGTWTWTLRLGSHGPAQACCSPACAPAAARRTPLGTGRDSQLPCRRRPPARPAAPMAGASGLLPLQLARVGGRGEGEGRCRPLRSPNGAGGWCQPCQCQLRLHICMEPLYMILDASQNLGERSSRAVAMPAAHG